MNGEIYSQYDEIIPQLKYLPPGQEQILYNKLENKYHVEGQLFIYNENEFSTRCYDCQMIASTPASTFKILNTLIGLETGVIKDENYVIKWDGVKRWKEEWNQDQSLAEAFKNSTVWYYQELATRIGTAKMKHWLDTCNYGNADTSGGIDQFWLSGGLRVNYYDQFHLLQKLANNRLPFSQRSMDITKKIMIQEETKDFILRAKTGWGFNDDQNVGWYIGYIDRLDKKRYYFVTQIFGTKEDNPDFLKARKEITMKMLKKLKII